MSSTGLTLWIPRWHPTPLNRLMHCHWSKKNRMKKADTHMVHAYLVRADGKLKGRMVRRRVAVTIVLQPGQRACDPDSQQKSLLDALKHADAIVDDNRLWCEPVPPQYERDAEWGTVIVLQDLDPVPGQEASARERQRRITQRTRRRQSPL